MQIFLTMVMPALTNAQSNKQELALANYQKYYWQNGYGADHKSVANLYKADVSLNNSWHTYAVLWSPDLYIFYVDGKESWRTTSAPSKALEELRLTCEITDMLWSGKPPVSGYGSLSESPYGMEVDWVRVWQKK
jgi:beta-glucanase (GH16 family)